MPIVQVEAAENYLHQRLQKIDIIIQQMMADVARYHATKEEMKQWRAIIDEKIRIARNAISVWSQSHRNLGNGTPVPPLIPLSSFPNPALNSCFS